MDYGDERDLWFALMKPVETDEPFFGRETETGALGNGSEDEVSGKIYGTMIGDTLEVSLD